MTDRTVSLAEGTPVIRTPAITEAVAHSVTYLASAAAQSSLEADPYWPKWDSPWWHMLLLCELGEARRMPERAIATLAARMNALPIKIFPIHPEDVPAGADEYRDSACHCSLGSLLQMLHACGIHAAGAVPWSTPWLVDYQLPDGGHNCDGKAYLSGERDASSMVATVPLLEALLLVPTWTEDQRRVADREARFLVERGLVRGSSSTFNAEERAIAPSWLAPCFPRFYFYDVLRGLAVLVRWAERTRQPIPRDEIAGAIQHLVTRFPDGIVRVERQAHAGRRTLVQRSGAWVREPTASTFPLLEATSMVGAPSEALTRQWSEVRRALADSM